MVSLASLWIPILLSAVLVFVMSSIIHMVLGYHKGDYGKVPNEDKVMEALRPFAIPPGEYAFPRPGSSKEMKDAAFVEKMNKGPVAFMTVMKNGPISMGGNLVQWFLYCAVVGLFAGYVAMHAVGPDSEYLEVFRFTGTVAFAGYGLALVQNSIWYKRAWSTTIKNLFDALIYALLTAGTFGWLWPS